MPMRPSHTLDDILDSLPARSRHKARAQPGARVEVERQPALTIAFHWGTVIAIAIAVAAIYARDLFEDKAVRAVLLDLHRQLGMLVLLCVPLRQMARYLAGHRDFSADLHAILRWGARLAHLVLYVFLIAIPLVGWAVTSAHGIDLRLFGVVPLPGLVTADSDLADDLTDYHAWLAYALMGLVFVHAAAALWHHYALRDSVLVAMLPGGKRRLR
jgi:superoxide oxidase